MAKVNSKLTPQPWAVNVYVCCLEAGNCYLLPPGGAETAAQVNIQYAAAAAAQLGGGEGAGRTGRGGDSQVLRVLARVLLPAAGEGEVGGRQGGRQRELVLVVDGEVVVQLG